MSSIDQVACKLDNLKQYFNPKVVESGHVPFTVKSDLACCILQKESQGDTPHYTCLRHKWYTSGISNCWNCFIFIQINTSGLFAYKAVLLHEKLTLGMILRGNLSSCKILPGSRANVDPSYHNYGTVIRK